MSPQEEEDILRLFGKSSLRPGQRELIDGAVAGRHVLGVLPTGHGKSLCYQAAACLLGGLSVVVSPLIALMREQSLSLQSLGIPAARFDSSLEDEERGRVLAQAQAGELRLLFVAPESLENPQLASTLAAAPLSLFVVDEAHCVSEWGHSFRPDYLRLPAFFARYPFRSLMALTATASPRVREDLCRAFSIAPQDSVVLSPYRPNIRRLCRACGERLPVLIDFVQEEGHRPAIVYCRTRKGAEEVAGELLRRGFSAACYHAGMPAEQREKLQDDFLHNRRDILVATIAFGMGIDKPDVRAVCHYNAPSSPEAYLQESGRAGRDGAPSVSLVLLQGADLRDARNRILGAEPDEEGVLRALRWLLPQGECVVSLWELETVCDVPEDVPRRALDMLQARGLLEETGRGAKYYKLRPLFPLNTILDGRDEAERTRLRWLDAHREGETEEAALAWGCSFAEAMAYLRDCEAAGEWKLSFRQQAVALRALQDADARALAQELSAAYRRRREGEEERLAQILRMLSAPHCLNASLEYYFMGDSAPACGHCSACLGSVDPLSPLPASQPPDYDPAELPELARSSQRRRFLLGISSPGLMARRLWKLPLYGCAKNADWEDL